MLAKAPIVRFVGLMTKNWGASITRMTLVIWWTATELNRAQIKKWWLVLVTVLNDVSIKI